MEFVEQTVRVIKLFLTKNAKLVMQHVLLVIIIHVKHVEILMIL